MLRKSLLKLFEQICQQNILPSFLDLLFPLKCLSCQAMLPESLELLCHDCLSEINPSQPQERCRSCYSYKTDDLCVSCLKEASPFFRTYAVFDASAPLEKLLQKLGAADGGFLAKSLAGLMLLKIEKSPLREFEVLVSSSDQASTRLTYALGELLKIPVIESYKKAEALTEKRVLMISTGSKAFSEYREEGILLAQSFPRSLQMLFFMRSYR